jgi:hypothetical protein
MKCSHINKVDAAYYHKRAVNLDVSEIPYFYPCHVCEGVEEEETEETELAGDAIERADRAVHDIFGPGSEEDIEFHQALCEVGTTTEALEELGGCEILPPLVPEIDD